MEIRSQRGFPQRLGKHKTLSTVPTRPDGGSIIGFTFFQRQRSTLHAAPDGIRTAKETQHQPNSTAEKGDILNELRMGTFSKSFDTPRISFLTTTPLFDKAVIQENDRC